MALAALVLAVVTFGPSLDKIVCRDEGGLAAAAAEMPNTGAAADHGDAGHGSEGPGACIHGHCHHGAPYAPAIATASETPDEFGSPSHPRARDRVPTSDPKFGLKRPPRA